MYIVNLFDELLSAVGESTFHKKRILEIEPKDSLDSKRLVSLQPSILVMIDLPEKREYGVLWLSDILCPHRYIESNFMYLSTDEDSSLGKFDLIWCTGVLYHNSEQLKFFRKLYKLLNNGGYLVLKSVTLLLAKSLRYGCYIETHYPETYRNTGTITHLPTANAIKAWLRMVGFKEIHDSLCFKRENRDLVGQRYSCI